MKFAGIGRGAEATVALDQQPRDFPYLESLERALNMSKSELERKDAAAHNARTSSAYSSNLLPRSITGFIVGRRERQLAECQRTYYENKSAYDNSSNP